MSNAESSVDVLGHVSENDEGSETIVFLHGLGSSLKEWHFVASSPHLSSYHRLLVDLPGHASSRKVLPLTQENTSKLLVDLILAKAHGRICHLVGFSAGGFVAVPFTHDHPELVKTLFVSGVYDLKARFGVLLKLNPYLEAFLGALPKALSQFVKEKALGIEMTYPPGLEEDIAMNRSRRDRNSDSLEMGKFGNGLPLSVRTLAVAAAKHDSPEYVRKLGEVLKQGNSESMAVKIEGAIHAWSVQMPDYPTIFAESISTWIEKRPLPRQLEPLL